jgi:hypothetical protein
MFEAGEGEGASTVHSPDAVQRPPAPASVEAAAPRRYGDPVPDVLPPRSWTDASETLLAFASDDLDAGGVPLPMLLAFEGDEPHAMVTLRPFQPDDLLQALVEVLSLLLPTGADRLACSLPARGPAGPEHELDVRHLLLVMADGHLGPCRTTLTLRPGVSTAQGWRWDDPLEELPSTETGLPAALSVLLDAREELVTGPSSELRLAAQFGRVLLLGHELSVAPSLARRLELATSS